MTTSDTFDNLDHVANWAKNKIETQGNEILTLDVQLRWALEGERHWARTAADRQQANHVLADKLTQALDRAAHWERMARELDAERGDAKLDNVRMRRVVEACVSHQTDPCRFDHHGNCQEHTSVGQVHGGCAVAVGKALLHQE